MRFICFSVTAWTLFTYGSIVRAEATTQPTWQEFAVKSLDLAEHRIDRHSDPRSGIPVLAQLSTGLDRPIALARIKRLAEFLRHLDDKLPDGDYTSAWSFLARLVQYEDTQLRDLFLREAITDAERALAEPRLWMAQPLPIGTRSWSDPQIARDASRQFLALQHNLWLALLKREGDPAGAIQQMAAVLADARGAGIMRGSDVVITFEQLILDELGLFDPVALKRLDPGSFDARAGKLTPDQWRTRHPGEFRPTPRKPLRGHDVTTTTREIAEIRRLGVSRENIEELFLLDQRAGLEELDRFIVTASPAELRAMTFPVARVSPIGLLRLYNRNSENKQLKPIDKLGNVRMFSILVLADPELAFREARSIESPEREVALGMIALGMKVHDAKRGQVLLDEFLDGATIASRMQVIGSTQELDPTLTHFLANPEAISTLAPTDLRQAAQSAALRGYEVTGSLAWMERANDVLKNPVHRDQVRRSIASRLTEDENWDAAMEVVRQMETAEWTIYAVSDMLRR